MQQKLLEVPGNVNTVLAEACRVRALGWTLGTVLSNQHGHWDGQSRIAAANGARSLG